MFSNKQGDTFDLGNGKKNIFSNILLFYTLNLL